MKKIYLLILITMIIFGVSSCTKNEEELYYKYFGGDQCLNGVYIANDIKYDISYLVSDETTLMLVEEVIDKVNEYTKPITGYEISYSKEKLEAIEYTIKIEEKAYGNRIAVNSVPTDGAAIVSWIKFYPSFFTYESVDQKQILKHELGHMLGLKDLYEKTVKKGKTMYYSNYQNNSIMYSEKSRSIQHEDYTAFDKQNLEYLYTKKLKK